jgi:predicted Zn-dependent protease
VTVNPVAACAVPINYATEDTANAFTDGDKIVIFSGIVALTRTDAQLAVLIGHELAHVNLGHRNKKTVNMVLGMVGGAAIDGGFALGGLYTGGAFSKQLGRTGLMAYSVGFEREADYVGAYYAARAGYDLAGTEDLWRAFGEMHPDSIRFATTHPTTPARFIQMRQVAAEIADKKRRHLPLVPDLKVAVDAQPAPADGNY